MRKLRRCYMYPPVDISVLPFCFGEKIKKKLLAVFMHCLCTNAFRQSSHVNIGLFILYKHDRMGRYSISTLGRDKLASLSTISAINNYLENCETISTRIKIKHGGLYRLNSMTMGNGFYLMTKGRSNGDRIVFRELFSFGWRGIYLRGSRNLK